MKKEKNNYYKTILDIFYFILVIIILTMLMYFIIEIVVFVIHAVKIVIDKYTTISVAIITGLLAFFSAIIGRFMENRYTIKNQIRKERQDVYIKFLDWFIDNLLFGELNNNKNIIGDLKEYQKLMTIFASDGVLKAWSEFKNATINTAFKRTDLSDFEKTKCYVQNEAPYAEKLILAIRKELGYKNRNIKKYDILKLYINDINKYL